jgi:Recombination endonuclease VII
MVMTSRPRRAPHDRPRLRRDAARRKPACWSWEITADALDAAYQARTQSQAYCVLIEWQRGRCAICGTSERELLLDHDHDTGLIRGLLCGSCNCREGWNSSNAVGLYRHMPPAFLLDMQIKKAVGRSLF